MSGVRTFLWDMWRDDTSSVSVFPSRVDTDGRIL